MSRWSFFHIVRRRGRAVRPIDRRSRSLHSTIQDSCRGPKRASSMVGGINITTAAAHTRNAAALRIQTSLEAARGPTTVRTMMTTIVVMLTTATTETTSTRRQDTAKKKHQPHCDDITALLLVVIEHNIQHKIT